MREECSIAVPEQVQVNTLSMLQVVLGAEFPSFKNKTNNSTWHDALYCTAITNVVIAVQYNASCSEFPNSMRATCSAPTPVYQPPVVGVQHCTIMSCIVFEIESP